MRQLFSPIHKPSSTLDGLTGALFASCPKASCFQYVDMVPLTELNPWDDLNVSTVVDVHTSLGVPASLPIMASNSKPETFLNNLPIFTAAQVCSIEETTRGQTSCDMWHSQRIGRITASISHDVMTRVETLVTKNKRNKDSTPLVCRVMGLTKPIQNIPALKYGRELESEARQMFRKEYCNAHINSSVIECGLFVKADQIFMAASPDGLVSCTCCGNGVLEIKCPVSMAGQHPNDVKIPCLEEDDFGQKTLRHSHPYYSQVIYQMGVTNVNWCYLFIYSVKGHVSVKVPFDIGRWNKLIFAAEYFFKHHVVSALYTECQDEIMECED